MNYTAVKLLDTNQYGVFKRFMSRYNAFESGFVPGKGKRDTSNEHYRGVVKKIELFT